MSSFLLIGGLAGLAAGTIVAFFSRLASVLGREKKPGEWDEPHLFGYQLNRREARLLGLLSHLLLSLVFGAGYGWLLQSGFVASFAVLPLLLWSVLFAFATGYLVLPLEGDGLFGHKHDVWFFVDLLITHGIWALFVAGFAALWFAS